MTDDNSGTENKVIFLGEAGVGKTSLIKVGIGEKFESSYNSSISLSFFPKMVEYNNKKYIFNLWDTIGQEKYRSLTKIFYKKSKIVIFVYDITKKDSFINLQYWIDSVNNELGNNKYIKAIIGNKTDLFMKEVISEEEAEKFAASQGAKFKTCSARNDPLAFTGFLDQLCIECIQKNEKTNNKNKNKDKDDKITLDKKKKKSKFHC